MPRYDYTCITCSATEEISKPYSEFDRIEIHKCGTEMVREFRMPNIDAGLMPSRNKNGASLGALKADEKELSSYFDATRQGVEPISTKKKDIDAAMRLSNEMGVAFNGNTI